MNTEMIARVNAITDDTIRIDLLQVIHDILAHDVRYYLQHLPSVSDFVYDELCLRFDRYQTQYPWLERPVGVRDGDVAHMYPMLSINSSYLLSDIVVFGDNTRSKCGDEISYTVERKIDGLSLELQYQKGKLLIAVTRGDGSYGKDVTLNALAIESIPNTIPDDSNRVTVTGEVAFTFSDYAQLCRARVRQGKGQYRSSRSAASGKLTAIRDVFTPLLSFFPYQYRDASTGNTQTKAYSEIFKELGFHYYDYPFISVVDKLDLTGMTKLIDINNPRQKNYDGLVALDGIVVKVNRYDHRSVLGEGNRHPHWSIAFKYANLMHDTRLIRVVHQVGRYGSLSPVGIVDPVVIHGKRVSNVSLGSYNTIASKDLHIGDRVSITLAKEIIPFIAGVASKGEYREKISPPTNCPCCSAPIVHIGAIYRCVNSHCRVKLVAQCQYLAGPKGLRIGGLGKYTLNKLFDLRVLEIPTDIFRLPSRRRAAIDCIGSKTAQPIIRRVSEIKSIELKMFIMLLGVRGISSSSSVIAKCAVSVENLLSSFRDTISPTLTRIDVDARNRLAEAIDTSGGPLLKELTKIGIAVMTAGRESTPSEYCVVITGSFPGITRAQLTSQIASEGGEVKPGLSKRTKYLIVGDKPGSNVHKANRLGVLCVNIDEFNATPIHIRKEK